MNCWINIGENRLMINTDEFMKEVNEFTTFDGSSFHGFYYSMDVHLSLGQQIRCSLYPDYGTLLCCASWEDPIDDFGIKIKCMIDENIDKVLIQSPKVLSSSGKPHGFKLQSALYHAEYAIAILLNATATTYIRKLPKFFNEEVYSQRISRKSRYILCWNGESDKPYEEFKVPKLRKNFWTV